MSWHRAIPIEFNHCDPAGIVFYPRYLEFTNSVVENFFADVLGHPFREIILEAGGGVPTRHVEVDFRAPSRLGDVIDFTLDVVRVGTSSVTFAVRGRVAGEVRVEARPTLVWLAPGGGMRPAPWPDDIRARLHDHEEPAR